MSFELVVSDVRLREILDQHRGDSFVAIDTEFRRRDTFFPQVALVQLCWNKVAYLIDPLAITELECLRELLLCEDTVKLLHSPSEDLEVFEHWLGLLPRPIFDTQRAQAILGHGFGLGYRALVEQFTGEVISKDETTSDWLKRPLTTQQLQYAALDVTYLRTVGETLHQEADERGRLDWVYEDTALLRPGGKGPAAKFKSAWKLNVREQQVLSALIHWREGEARALNRPRSWVVPDKVLSQLTRLRPSHITQLKQVEGLHDAVVRKRGEAIIAVIAASSASVSDQAIWAPPIRGPEKEWSSALTTCVKDKAHALAIAPELLLSGKDIESLIRGYLAQEALPTEFCGWRNAVIVEELLDRLAVLDSRAVASD